MRIASVFCAAMLVTSCRPSAPEGVVARIADREVRVEEFAAYVADVLQDTAVVDATVDPPADPARAEALREASIRETDRVQSRLLDAMIDEELLLYEADRLELQVDEDQVRSFAAGLRAATPAADSDRPEITERDLDRVRRTMRIQAVLARSLPGEPPPDEGEVDAAMDRGDGGAPPEGRRLRLRSLVLPSADVAARLYAEIRSKQLTFDEAAVRQAFSMSQTQAAEVALDQLPPQVQEAIRRLKTKGVSRPTELHGETYLFQVESWLTADLAAESERRSVARSRIAVERAAAAERRLLDELRVRYDVEVFPGNLPFTYVPEDDAPRPLQ